MALIDWNSNFSVNVEEIDQQHKKLIAIINELNEAMKQGKGKEVLGKIVDHMTSYTVTHFKTEEDYFARFSYPDAGNHKKEHASFVTKASELRKDFGNGKITLSIDVMEFLSKWLKDHIMGTDKKYAKFFNEKGLK